MVGRYPWWPQWRDPEARPGIGCGLLQLSIRWRCECLQAALCLDTGDCLGPFVPQVVCRCAGDAEPGSISAKLQAAGLILHILKTIFWTT